LLLELTFRGPPLAVIVVLVIEPVLPADVIVIPPNAEVRAVVVISPLVDTRARLPPLVLMPPVALIDCPVIEDEVPAERVPIETAPLAVILM
jgi:hypothetical protein